MTKVILTLLITLFSFTCNANQERTVSAKDRECLIINTYHEADNSLAGMISVNTVVHNRLRSGKWGKTYCSVIYAPWQFSWTLDKRKRYSKINYKVERWRMVAESVDMFLNGSRIQGIDGAIAYHATWVSPSWGKRLQKLAVVGGHYFYKERNM